MKIKIVNYNDLFAVKIRNLKSHQANFTQINLQLKITFHHDMEFYENHKANKHEKRQIKQ